MATYLIKVRFWSKPSNLEVNQVIRKIPMVKRYLLDGQTLYIWTSAKSLQFGITEIVDIASKVLPGAVDFIRKSIMNSPLGNLIQDISYEEVSVESPTNTAVQDLLFFGGLLTASFLLYDYLERGDNSIIITTGKATERMIKKAGETTVKAAKELLPVAIEVGKSVIV